MKRVTTLCKKVWRGAISGVVLAMLLSACVMDSDLAAPPEAPVRYSIHKENHILASGRVNYLGLYTVRLLETTWRMPESDHPQVDGPFPLIIYSHGNTLNKNDMGYLLDALTERGYVTVAYNYPYNSLGRPTNPWDIFNIPGDISFLIDQFTAYNQDASHPLYGKLDTERIASIGYSYGAVATLMSCVLDDFHEPRISLGVSIADGGLEVLTDISGTSFSSLEEPNAEMLFIQGDEDEFFPIETTLARYAEYDFGKYFAVLGGMDHYGFQALLPAGNDLQHEITRRVITAFLQSRWGSGTEKTSAEHDLNTSFEGEYEQLNILHGET